MLYLALALWGAVHPMLHLAGWTGANGWGLAGLWAARQANAATSALAWEVAIAGIALTVWVIAETWVRRNWLALVAIPVSFGIGIGCGLPLYLYLRTRPVR